MNDLRYILPISRLFSLLLMFSLSGCEGTATPAVSPTGDVRPELDLETLNVSEQIWPRIVRSQGSLFPDEEATLGIKVEGRVFKTHVDLGDVVQAGDVLITIYQDDFKLRVKHAKALLTQTRSAVGLLPGDSIENLSPEKSPPVREQRAAWDEAIANLERARGLHQKKVMGQSEYDLIVSLERVAAARYTSALNGVREKIANISVQQALLDLAEEDLNNTVLKASYSAVVQKRLVAPGSYIKMGDPLLVLVRIDQLRYRGSVPERLATSVEVGQSIELDIESMDPVKTKITRVSPFLNQTSRSLLFEAMVDNSSRKFRAGLFAEGEITVDPHQKAMVVPMSSVVQFAGAEKVWKVIDGEVKMQEVLLGEQRGEQIRILEGLKPGDTILRNAREGRTGTLARTKR